MAHSPSTTRLPSASNLHSVMTAISSLREDEVTIVVIDCQKRSSWKNTFSLFPMIFKIYANNFCSVDDEQKNCNIEEYVEEVRDILLQSPVPVFIIPGGNSFSTWMTYFFVLIVSPSGSLITTLTATLPSFSPAASASAA
jgi:hypothetical protein